MAFFQDMKIPNPVTGQFNIGDFSGGLNNVTSPMALRHDESPNLLNVLIRPGIVETRPGLFKYLSNNFADTIRAMFEFNGDLILSSQTKLYLKKKTEDLVTEICTLSSVANGFQYKDKFFFVDGQKFRVWYNNKVYTITKPTIADAPGATVIDDVNNEIRYQPKDTETSDPFKGPNVIDMIANAKDITLHRNRIYFSVDPDNKNLLQATDLDNPYYVPTNLFIPTVTNDKDSVVGTISFNDSLVIFKTHSVFALYGDTHNDFQLKEVTVTEGAVNMDVVKQVGNYLYYLAPNGVVYSIYDVRTDVKKLMTKSMSDNINLQRAPISLDPTYYTHSSRAIFFDNKYILAIHDKVLVYDFNIQCWMLWDNLNPSAMLKYDNRLLMTRPTDFDNLNSPSALCHMPLRRLTITETIEYTPEMLASNTNTFAVKFGYIDELDDNPNAFVTVTKSNGTVEVDAIKLSNSEFKIDTTDTTLDVSDKIKIKYLSLSTYNDDGVGYVSYYHTKDNNFGYANKSKQFRKVFFTTDTFKYFSSTMDIKALVDYYDVTADIVISNQVSLFGTSKFGDLFISRNIPTTYPFQVNRRGRVVRFVFESNGFNQPFRLFSISGEFIVRNS